jgi:orotate phosphoribosyltransferase
MVAIFTYGFDVAVHNFNEASVPLVCLSDFENLLPIAVQKGMIQERDLENIREWRSNPADWGK